MKDFLKFTFATVVGLILASVALFFISILFFFSAVSSADTETEVRANSIMVLDLKGELLERNQSLPYDMFMSEDYQYYGLDDILSSIRKAKENENIKGIYLRANFLTAGYASIEEIRDALLDFKESGKFVAAYADNYTQGLYYLASAADKVMMNPKGSLEWRGIAAAPMFYKDLLEKIGYTYDDMRQDGVMYPVATVELKFVKSAFFKQKLIAEAVLEEYQPAMVIKYRILDAETKELLCKAKTMQICVNINTGESVYSAPENFVKKLDRIEE